MRLIVCERTCSCSKHAKAHISELNCDIKLYSNKSPPFADNENNKFSILPPSSHGSLSSITTTSIASSEDPRGGDDDNGNDKSPKMGSVKHEEWWKTTLQVSIPFLVAGVGTIGAGVILGRVEVIHSPYCIIHPPESSSITAEAIKIANMSLREIDTALQWRWPIRI